MHGIGFSFNINGKALPMNSISLCTGTFVINKF